MKASDEHLAKVRQYEELLSRLGDRVKESRSGQVGRLCRVRLSYDTTPARGWQTGTGYIDCDIIVSDSEGRNVADYVRFLDPKELEFL